MSNNRGWTAAGRLAALLATFLLSVPGAATAADAPYPGTVTVASAHGYADTVARLETTIEAQKMGLVAPYKSTSPA